jgi:hypothetical protein
VVAFNKKQQDALRASAKDDAAFCNMLTKPHLYCM